MNARFYDPQTARFISQDTYSGNPYDPWTQHLYSYCSNNPVNFIDPTGHKRVWVEYEGYFEVDEDGRWWEYDKWLEHVAKHPDTKIGDKGADPDIHKGRTLPEPLEKEIPELRAAGDGPACFDTVTRTNGHVDLGAPEGLTSEGYYSWTYKRLGSANVLRLSSPYDPVNLDEFDVCVVTCTRKINYNKDGSYYWSGGEHFLTEWNNVDPIEGDTTWLSVDGHGPSKYFTTEKILSGQVDIFDSYGNKTGDYYEQSPVFFAVRKDLV